MTKRPAVSLIVDRPGRRGIHCAIPRGRLVLLRRTDCDQFALGQHGSNRKGSRVLVFVPITSETTTRGRSTAIDDAVALAQAGAYWRHRPAVYRHPASQWLASSLRTPTRLIRASSYSQYCCLQPERRLMNLLSCVFDLKRPLRRFSSLPFQFLSSIRHQSLPGQIPLQTRFSQGQVFRVRAGPTSPSQILRTGDGTDEVRRRDVRSDDAGPRLAARRRLSRFHGLRVGVGASSANSVVVVLPRMIAPAALRRSTTAES
jgi:hypothetical protein